MSLFFLYRKKHTPEEPEPEPEQEETPEEFPEGMICPHCGKDYNAPVEEPEPEPTQE